jgi:hypothetical protein
MRAGGAALVVMVAACACGSLDDDRPETLTYIQAAIIEPTCAKAQCHSSFAQVDGQNYGTLADTRLSWIQDGWVFPEIDDVGPQSQGLIVLLTHGLVSTFSDNVIRCPPDEPMPAEDIEFLERWLGSADALGLGAPGAQCVPNAQGVGCFNENPVPCSPEGNVLSLTPTTMCSASEICDVVTGSCKSPAL